MMPVAGMVMVTNLSTGIIIMGIAFIIIFTASRQWLPFFVLMGLGGGFMGIFLKLASYRVGRIEAWLNVETHQKVIRQDSLCMPLVQAAFLAGAMGKVFKNWRIYRRHIMI